MRERPANGRFVVEHSLYQQARLNPAVFGAIAVGAGLDIAAWLKARGNGSRWPG